MAANSVVRVFIINIVVIIVVVALLFGGYIYYNNSVNYVSSQDAQVTGTMVPITVQFSGKINNWYVTVNSTVNQGETLGTESNTSVLALNAGLGQAVARSTQLQKNLKNREQVTAPITGTVIQNNVSVGQIVQPGQVMAQLVNLNTLYVTANIPETGINQVNVGQKVDVTIDGIPNTTFNGTVMKIENATQSAFSEVPNLTSMSGSYTKVMQRIPVLISLDQGYSGKPIVPGMNAEVRIHVNNNG